MMAHFSSVDTRRRARTMGVVSLGEDAGEIAGPVLAGFLWGTWGVATLFGVRIVMAVVAESYTVVVLSGRLDHGSRAQPPIEAAFVRRDV